MAGTTFSQFTTTTFLPPSGNGSGGSVNTANKVLMSTGGGTTWTTTPVAAGGTGGTTPQTALNGLASPAGTDLNLGGDINLTTGSKITGDFSNAAINGARTVVQTSLVNNATHLTAVPNGTVAAGYTTAALELHDSTSGAGNGSYLRIANVQDSEMRISSLANGVGTVRPIAMYVGNARALTVQASGTTTTTTQYGQTTASLALSTQTANAGSVLSVLDNGGTPYTHFHTLSGSGVLYQDFNTQYFRNAAGSNQLVLGNVGQIGVGSSGNYGTTGQFLQSNGNSAAPVWTSNVVDLTGAQSITGYKTFTKGIELTGDGQNWLRMQGGSGGDISFFDIKDPDPLTVGGSPVYNYTMRMDSAAFRFAMSTVNAAYDYGTELMTLDAAGTLVTTGNIGAYSDPRLKENFEIIANPHGILSKLDGGTFTWKSGDDLPTNIKAGKRDYGVMADQVAAIMPEIVSNSGEYMVVAYDKLIPVLLEAIKDLNARVIELENK